MVDWTVVFKSVLFALFAQLTLALWVVTGATYDGLFVPMMSASSLYPGLPPGPVAPGSFLTTAATFSDYMVANVVDPLVAVVAVVVGLLYLFRASFARWGARFDHLI